MKYRLFQYTFCPRRPELDDLNSFLQSQRVATVVQHVVQTPGGAVSCLSWKRLACGNHPIRSRVKLIIGRNSVFERGAIAQSYACRVGRGQHAALAQLRRWLQPDDWFLKVDIAKFYDSVNRQILRLQLARRFRERRLLDLLNRLLASYACREGKGLPIGALTSQYLGNFYLDPIDHWVKQSRQLPPLYALYGRHAVSGGAGAASRESGATATVRWMGLGLQIKNGGILNRATLGVPYLGFVLYPDRIRLNRLGRRRLRRRCTTSSTAWAHGPGARAGIAGARRSALRPRPLRRRCCVAPHGDGLFTDWGDARTRPASCGAAPGTTRPGTAARRYRNRNRPDDRNRNNGFRVCLVRGTEAFAAGRRVFLRPDRRPGRNHESPRRRPISAPRRRPATESPALDCGDWSPLLSRKHAEGIASVVLLTARSLASRQPRSGTDLRRPTSDVAATTPSYPLAGTRPRNDFSFGTAGV